MRPRRTQHGLTTMRRTLQTLTTRRIDGRTKLAVAVRTFKAEITRDLDGDLSRAQQLILERGVIAWPPSECKADEAHVIPLEGVGLAIVERLMARPRLHCPYLFHGPDCAPGH